MPTLFTSESVSDGHPDKVADFISDCILDNALQKDPYSLVACETLVKGDRVIIAGEINSNATLDYSTIVENAIRSIGYIHEDLPFYAPNINVFWYVSEQSREINKLVYKHNDLTKIHKNNKVIGAGDQGMVFGYACRDTKEYMPAPIAYSHKLGRRIKEIRKNKELDWIRPDSKVQVTVAYNDNNKVDYIDTIVISTQHTKDTSQKTIQEAMQELVIKKVIPQYLLTKKTKYLINPYGSFINGSPYADAGLTGRKIMVDTYGGYSRHGGGAFSGKDGTKIDRSAAYYARYVAKNMVAAGISDRFELGLAYVIGATLPIDVHYETFGTAHVDDKTIDIILKKCFDFSPEFMINFLNLRYPLFRLSTNYGHFGYQDCSPYNYPWEQLHHVRPLRSYLSNYEKIN